METKDQEYSVINIAAAMSVTGLIYLGSFINPVLSLISAEYPTVDPSMLKSVTMIPSLMMVIMSLVSGGLTSKYPIKKIVLFATCFSIVGGMMPVFTKSFTALIVSRVIFGIGHGMVFPMASAIINQLFTGAKRDKLMGIRAGIGALLGSAYTTIAGIVGVTGWRHAVACTAIAIPLWLFIAWKCPNNEVYEKPKAAADGSAVKESKFTGKTWMLFVVLFVYNMMMVTFGTNLSLVVAAEGIGTTAQAGTISSTNTLCAFFAGLLFGSVKKSIRRFVSPLAFALVGCALIILCFAHNLALFYVAAVFYGFGFGFYNPAITVVVAQSAAKPQYASVAIAGYTSAIGIGQFLASMVLKRVAVILGITGVRSDWLIAAPVIVVITIAAVVYIMVTGGPDGKKESA